MSMSDKLSIDLDTLRALVTSPTVWITVIRKGSTAVEVGRYVNDWPVAEMTDGMFLVCTLATQTWLADRLASGLFYAKVHDTYAEAEADAVANVDLIH